MNSPKISLFIFLIKILKSSSSTSDNSTTSTINNNDCNDDEYRCLTSMECIPKWWRCDHIIDCQDGSDEWLQSDFNEFDYVLDVDEDPMRSYEASLFNDTGGSNDNNNNNNNGNNASIVTPTTKLNSTSLNSILIDWCQPCDTNEMFRCQQTNECIPRGWLCDGQPDCGNNDNSDEINHQCYSITETPLLNQNIQNNLTIDITNYHQQPYILLYNQTHFLTLIRSFNNISNAHHVEFKSSSQMDKMSSLISTRDSSVCWLVQDAINCVSLANEKNWKTTLVEQLLIPHYINIQRIDRIELDWQTQQWYMLDRTNELLYRFNQKLQHCSVVIDHQVLSRPLDFQIDVKQKWIFISRQGDRSRSSSQSLSPAILRADSLDGSQIKTLVQIRIIEPRHLALDIIKRRLYWIDRKLDSLEYVDYNGNYRHKLKIESKSVGPSWLKTMKMFANDDFVYLLSTNKQQFKQSRTMLTNTTITSSNNNKTTMMMNNKNGTILTLSLIQVSRKLMMRQTYRSKDSINATIIINNNSIIQSTFAALNKTIITNDDKQELSLNWSKPVLIYSRLDPGLIKFLQLDSIVLNNDNDSRRNHKDQKTILPITFSRSPTTFDIDPFERKIYYLDDYDTNLLYHDLALNQIVASSFSLEPSSKLIKRIDLKFFGSIDRIESISFDWCNQNVYLVERSSISVMSIRPGNGDNEKTMNFKKTIIKNLIEPSTLVLDPEHGLMFFNSIIEMDDKKSTTKSYSYTINRSNMDGSNIMVVIQLNKASYINALALNTIDQHLYWCDNLDKMIYRINYDGTDNKYILQSSRINLANSLTYFDSSIYWTELQHGTIQRFNLETNRTELIWQERAPLFQIKIWENIQTNNSNFHSINCLNKTNVCQQITLRTSGGQSICSCDDHFKMDSMGHCYQLSIEDLTKKFCHFHNEMYLINGRRCISFTKFDREVKNVSNISAGKPDKEEKKEFMSLPLKECQAKEFGCDQGRRCIPYHWLCDGHKDCFDQTDERKICQSISLPDFRCPEGYFQCRHRPLCIPDQWRCDQQQDCGDDDASDEEKCN